MKNFLFLFIFISSITASFAQNTDGSQTGDNSLDNKNLQEANLAIQDNLWANNGVDFNNFDGMPGGEGTALPSCDPNSPNPETCGTLDNSNSTSGFFDKITKTMNKTVENMRVKVEELVTEKHAQFANTGAFTGASQRVLYSTGGSTSTSVKTVQSKNCENVAPGISTCFGETINGVGEGNSSLFDTLEAISFFNSKEQILNMDESNCEKCFGKYEQMYKNSQRGGKRVLNKNIIEDGVKEKIKLRKLKFEALKLVNKIESLGDAGSVRSETVNRSKLSCLDNNFLETELTAVNCSKSDSDLLKTTFAKIGVRGVDKTLDLNKITKTLERKKSLFCSSGQLSRKNYVNLNTRNLYIKDTSAYHQLKDATDLFDTKFTKKEVNHLCHSKKDITPFEYLQKIIVSNNDLETFDFGFKDPLFKILLTSKKAFCSYQKNRSPSSGVLNFLRLKEGGDKNALLALQKKVMHNYDSSCKKNIKNIVKVACSDISGDLNEVVAKYGHTEMKNSLRDVLLESVDDNGDFFQKRAVGIATLTCQLSSVEKGKSLETNYDSVDLLQSGEYSDLSLQELKKELIAQKDYIVNKKEVDNLLKSSFLGSEIPKEEERVCPKFVFSNKSMREKLYGEQRTAGERKKDLVQEVRSSSGGDGKLKGEILSEAERNSLRNGLNGKNTASTTKKTLDGGAEIKEIEDSRFTSLSGSGSTYNPAGPDSMTSQYLPEVPAIGDFTESDLDKVKEFTKDPDFSKIYDSTSYASGKLMLDESTNSLVGLSKTHISFVSPSKLSSKPSINKIYLPADLSDKIFSYESVLSLGDNQYLFGTSRGYLIVNLNRNQNNNNYQVNLNLVENSNGETLELEVLLNEEKKQIYRTQYKVRIIGFIFNADLVLTFSRP